MKTFHILLLLLYINDNLTNSQIIKVQNKKFLTANQNNGIISKENLFKSDS